MFSGSGGIGVLVENYKEEQTKTLHRLIKPFLRVGFFFFSFTKFWIVVFFLEID